jgi:hypothetical protein
LNSSAEKEREVILRRYRLGSMVFAVVVCLD